MSSQQPGRVRRIASPAPTKSGPMKATLTFGLNVQAGSPNQAIARSSNGRKISPTSSPTPQWGADCHRKNRRSPDSRLSPDRAASSSPAIKEKQKSPGYHMKRTASYDTITPYLKGEWPKEAFLSPVPPPPPQTTDRETQTPEEWEEQLSTADRIKKASHKRSSSAGNGDSYKEVQKFRHRLAKSNKESVRTGSSSSSVRTSPVQGKHSASNVSVQTKAMAVPLLAKPTIRIRNSVEGPSQEIETLVYKKQTSGPEDWQNSTQELGQDGHRAPVRDLLAAGNTRTVDTQTPSGPDERLIEEDRSCSSSASDSPSSLPIIPLSLDSPRPSSRSDSSDIVTIESKVGDLLFIREPPDGCERVRIMEEPSQIAVADLEFCPIKNTPPQKWTIPSNRSAFLPLLKRYVNQPSEMALRTADRPLEGQ